MILFSNFTPFFYLDLMKIFWRRKRSRFLIARLHGVIVSLQNVKFGLPEDFSLFAEGHHSITLFTSVFHGVLPRGGWSLQSAYLNIPWRTSTGRGSRQHRAVNLPEHSMVYCHGGGWSLQHRAVNLPEHSMVYCHGGGWSFQHREVGVHGRVVLVDGERK